ncbi:MAG: hypothetical protein H6622_05585 [Halobacteriovoraceae bacterium]|nr:hypothetical protein [Halobacteriovoraceae bacterium]
MKRLIKNGVIILLIFVTSCGKDTQFFKKDESFFNKVVDKNQDVNDSDHYEENPDDPTKNYITETFYQTSTREDVKIDIVWVIDNSLSMYDEQEALANNFDSFINGFIQKHFDFKMAITTIDPRPSDRNFYSNLIFMLAKDQTQYDLFMDEYDQTPQNSLDGGMLNPIGTLTSQQAATDMNSFLNDFDRYILTDLYNFRIYESGLYVMKRFAQRNSSFFRDDAYTIFIVISDEEDQSHIIAPYYDNYFYTEVSEYVNFLKNRKSNPSLTKIFSIVKKNSPLYNDETYGDRYIEASRLTNGISRDIDLPFSEILSDFSDSIVHLADNFLLTQTPIDGQIQVKVNSEVIANSEYTFTLSEKKLIFDKDFLPTDGSKIEVTYLISN